MRYRAPVRFLGVPRAARPTEMSLPAPSIFDLANGMNALQQIMRELEQAKATHEETVTRLVADAQQKIAAAIAHAHAHVIKGDKPVAGVDYVVPQKEDVIREVLAHIPLPKDGADGKDVDEQGVVERIYGRVMAMLPPEIDPETVASFVLRKIVPPKGTDGKDADPTGIIDEIMRRLTDGKTLKAEHVEGMPKTLQEFRARGSYVGGGGDTVLAGANVTITKNAAGRKVISTIVGGFTTLTATETPDGTHTIFTFAAATAQPTFIINDNVMQRATTKKGTINWTWNAGTKQATMSVAPTDDILGVV